MSDGDPPIPRYAGYQHSNPNYEDFEMWNTVCEDAEPGWEYRNVQREEKEQKAREEKEERERESREARREQERKVKEKAQKQANQSLTLNPLQEVSNRVNVKIAMLNEAMDYLDQSHLDLLDSMDHLDQDLLDLSDSLN
jgi:CRISPR/Cas system-associated protein Cas10 (large subunit of type III CRISPR-Cas system)